MLHIHNGDSTANTLRDSGFPGKHFAFREALATGPTPQNLSKDDWIAVRATHLAEQIEPDAAKVAQELVSMDAALTDIINRANHEDVILWFEHDLFCQINLIFLLNKFARQDIHPTHLSLICIGEFPGIADFRGLGQLTADQMASLFDTRHSVTEAELNLGQSAWTAYCSSNPHDLETLLATDTSALPFLANAIRQHLARFPSVRNGLGHAENRLLGFIADGVKDVAALCPKFFNAEPAYGLGDLQIRSDLLRMAEVAEPLIHLESFDDLAGTDAWLKAKCDITETGRRVLAGQADYVRLNGIDLWMGGIHLTNENLWRWDEEKQTLLWTANLPFAK